MYASALHEKRKVYISSKSTIKYTEVIKDEESTKSIYWGG